MAWSVKPMKPVIVSGIGLMAPGLHGWSASREILAEIVPYVPTECPKPVGTCLRAAERRRATSVTRLALDVASEALGNTQPSRVTSIFTSSGGEVEIIHGIFEQLASEDRRLSPTAFHNSVHNAAAGYWSIASGSHHSADSLCAYDDSFGTGLGEALLRCAGGERDVLLVAIDLPPLFPIAEFRQVTQPFAVALLLNAFDESAKLARLAGQYAPTPPASVALDEPALDSLRLANPTARSLSLLMAIAAGRRESLNLGYGMGGSMMLEVEPCR
jgi:hypothetical protein